MSAAGPRPAGLAPALHHVRDGGAGPPLVLLAGIGMDGSAWSPVLEWLTSERVVWRVDLPGFGGSAAITGEPPGIGALAGAASGPVTRWRWKAESVAWKPLLSSSTHIEP